MNKKKTILISGAGGSATYSLVQELQKNNYRVIACDMYANSVGFLYADKSYLIPAGKSNEFTSAVAELCKKEDVALFIPLVDEELIKSCTLRDKGINVLLPEKNFCELCLDKYRLMKRLSEIGLNVPKTAKFDEDFSNFKYPRIIKPITGRGSRGVQIINNDEDMIPYFKKTNYTKEELIMQEYIEGDEYTVSAVVSHDGLLQAVVPKKIILKQGITKLAVTEKNQKIYECCKVVQEKLHANGPFNVQLRIGKNDGLPYIFEINPRFSTTITLTMASGVNELMILVKQMLNEAEPKIIDNWKENVVLARQNQDCFMDIDEYNKRSLTEYAF